MKGTPVELVTIETEDGFPLDGVVYRPPADVDRRQALLLIHGKTLNFYSGTSRCVPPAVVARGFTCLSLNLRSHDLGYLLNSYQNHFGAAWEMVEHPPKDIRAGIRALREEGLADVALLGHSAGGMFVAGYAATNPELKALVLSAPSPSLAPVPLARWFAGDAEAVARITRQAQEMVAGGRGHELIALPNWWWAVSAGTVLDILGHDPNALVNAVQRAQCPTLFIYGSRDSPLTMSSIERAMQASSARRKDVVVVEGADHFYNGRQSIMADSVAHWLEVVMEPACTDA